MTMTGLRIPIRIAFILCTLVAIITLFAACGPSDGAATGSEGSPETEGSRGESAAPDPEPDPAEQADTDDTDDTDEPAESEEAAEASAPETVRSAPEGLTPLYDITTRDPGPPTDSFQAYRDWILRNTNHTDPFIEQRWNRAQAALVHYNPPDITHQRVLEAFLRTPREFFAREWNLHQAYIHNYMPIGHGVTISGPHIVARMTDTINPQPWEKVLEIGTGSGYQAAFLAELSNFVYTIEIIEPLSEETDALFTSYEETHPQYRNIRRKTGDGYYGWEEHAPFDKIIVTAGIDHIPPPLIAQLAVGGEMVIPVGPPSVQQMLHVTKTQDEDGTVRLTRRDIYEGTGRTDPVIFVPFTSEGGTGVHSGNR